MKSLLEITSWVLLDCSSQCGVNPKRDLEQIAWRVEHEGESFLTITLPTLSAGLEKALADGRWEPALAPAFESGRGRSLPRFLGGFFSQVFDDAGVLLQHSRNVSSAIWAIRQVCRVVSKLFLPASQKRVAKALRRFVEVEKEIGNHATQTFNETFYKVSRIVWSEIVGSGGFNHHYQLYHPRHGRGTTAEGITGNDKFHFRTWPLRLEREFPFTEFGIANVLNDRGQELAHSVTYLLPRDEVPVKVTPVPKTAKTPRIIAIEPVAMQYMQQAIADWVRPRIEHRCRLTAGHVNFSDQSINNQLARTASRSGDLATIDLSDASDRVSCKHVATMLSGVPEFMRHVFATRSTRANIPGRADYLALRKFASMGSALCFPMEAMVFFIALISSRIARSGRTVRRSEVRRASRDIYVYGDDLIVPARLAPSMVEDLELFGLKVNAAKSFWTGKFRESCGGDYYDGEDVKPVYLRRKFSGHRADVQGFISAVSFANQCYFAGMWETCKRVRSFVDETMGPLPSVLKESQVLGWESFSNALSFQSWDDNLQRPKLRGYVIAPRRKADVLDDDPALLKCFRLIANDDVEKDHLRTSVRYGNLALKRRWT